MDVKPLFEKLIASGVVMDSLAELPDNGADDQQISLTQAKLGTVLPSELVSLLKTYDGANLEVIRFNSIGSIEMSEQGFLFASCPAGFMYHITSNGEVIVEDTDGGDMDRIASSLHEFIYSYLFGSRSAEFCGAEWYQELVAAGIAT